MTAIFYLLFLIRYLPFLIFTGISRANVSFEFEESAYTMFKGEREKEGGFE